MNLWKESRHTSVPLPKTASFIREPPYSLDHHSISRRRVSRPAAPPSNSTSDVADGAGDPSLGVNIPGLSKLLLLDVVNPFSAILACRAASRPAANRLSRLPLPNFLHLCPSWLRPLPSWNKRQPSCCLFFLCSESTAFSSLNVQDA